MSEKIIPINKKAQSKKNVDTTDMQDNDTKRICVDFGKQALETLSALKVEVGATTYSEVMRDAVRLYIWAVAQKQEGYEVQSVKKEGKTTHTRTLLIPL